MASLISFLTRPEFWLALILLALLLGLLAWRLRLRWWPAWPMRLLLVGLVLLSLLPTIQALNQSPIPQRQVMVVDQSDSLAEETRLHAYQQALAWQSGAENRLVVVYGAESQAVLAEEGQPDPANAFPDEQTVQVDGRASDLAGALRLAGSLLEGSEGKVILASDGLPAQPSLVDQAVDRLAENGHTLDVIPLLPRSTQNDLALGELSAPRSLWAGTGFDLLVPVLGGWSGAASDLQLVIDGQVTGIPAELVGENTYRFRIPSLSEGIVTLQVTGSAGLAGEDPFPGNNSAYTVLQVFAPPRVLFVTARQESEAAVRFVQMLADSGIQVDPIPPEALPTNLDSLQDYRVIFLDNLLSSQLTREQMMALQVFVSRLAGGVIFMGGRNSYTLGGYKGSLLEPMLPVKLEPPPRTERTPIVFQLILDRSSSMGMSGIGEDLLPIVLAREAAMRSVETLRSEDYLGVLTFSDEPNWDIPLRPLGDSEGLRQALDAINQVEAYGTTMMFQAMGTALDGMFSLPDSAPQNRHLLILSDGQSTDGTNQRFRRLARTARSQGITISTIALGEDSDPELMEEIADAGMGRFYEVIDVGDLPRIMISESQAARSENVQQGETSLRVGEAGHPVLSGISQSQLPLLTGYNALSSRAEEGAEDVLLSENFGDPILSTWQYGLGRVAAWTGDIGEEWTGRWPSAGEGMFWAQVIQHSLVDPALSPAQVSVEVEPDRLLVEASIYNADGEPVNLAEVTFILADPSSGNRSYRLAQTSAGSYELELPRPQDGAYRAIISYMGEDGERVEVPAPFAVNPPEEWLPPEGSAGAANLETWARSTGGVSTSIEQVIEQESELAAGEAGRGEHWWWLLMLALVILWPLEIVIRRRWLPWV